MSNDIAGSLITNNLVYFSVPIYIIQYVQKRNSKVYIYAHQQFDVTPDFN
jgi:hypothetical protein